MVLKFLTIQYALDWIYYSESNRGSVSLLRVNFDLVKDYNSRVVNESDFQTDFIANLEGLVEVEYLWKSTGDRSKINYLEIHLLYDNNIRDEAAQLYNEEEKNRIDMEYYADKLLEEVDGYSSQYYKYSQYYSQRSQYYLYYSQYYYSQYYPLAQIYNPPTTPPRQQSYQSQYSQQSYQQQVEAPNITEMYSHYDTLYRAKKYIPYYSPNWPRRFSGAADNKYDMISLRDQLIRKIKDTIKKKRRNVKSKTTDLVEPESDEFEGLNWLVVVKRKPGGVLETSACQNQRIMNSRPPENWYYEKVEYEDVKSYSFRKNEYYRYYIAPRIFYLGGPSGVGKTTFIKQIQNICDTLNVTDTELLGLSRKYEVVVFDEFELNAGNFSKVVNYLKMILGIDTTIINVKYSYNVINIPMIIFTNNVSMVNFYICVFELFKGNYQCANINKIIEEYLQPFYARTIFCWVDLYYELQDLYPIIIPYIYQSVYMNLVMEDYLFVRDFIERAEYGNVNGIDTREMFRLELKIFWGIDTELDKDRASIIDLIYGDNSETAKHIEKIIRLQNGQITVIADTKDVLHLLRIFKPLIYKDQNSCLLNMNSRNLIHLSNDKFDVSWLRKVNLNHVNPNLKPVYLIYFFRQFNDLLLREIFKFELPPGYDESAQFTYFCRYLMVAVEYEDGKMDIKYGGGVAPKNFLDLFQYIKSFYGNDFQNLVQGVYKQVVFNNKLYNW